MKREARNDVPGTRTRMRPTVPWREKYTQTCALAIPLQREVRVTTGHFSKSQFFLRNEEILQSAAFRSVCGLDRTTSEANHLRGAAGKARNDGKLIFVLPQGPRLREIINFRIPLRNRNRPSADDQFVFVYSCVALRNLISRTHTKCPGQNLGCWCSNGVSGREVRTFWEFTRKFSEIAARVSGRKQALRLRNS